LEGRVSPWLLVIPLAWSVVATAAALSLGMVEDLGLTAAGILALFAAGWRNRRLASAARAQRSAEARAGLNCAAPLAP
jgi:hypothetical protein